MIALNKNFIADLPYDSTSLSVPEVACGGNS